MAKTPGSLNLAILSLTLFCSGCIENPGEFALGREFIASETVLSVIDTFSVHLSTVLLDTVETSGTGALLVGSYHDNVFGRITSNSYFQLSIPETASVENRDQYDSLRLAIRYNGYSFGDTTRSLKISVHQLTENIDNEHLTSRTSFSYNRNPIGSVIFTPQPHNSDTLFITITDAVGLDLFAKLRDNSGIMTNQEAFRNYFHGLALVTDIGYDGSIVGFRAAEEDVKLELFSTKGDSPSEMNRVEFRLADTTKQFNNIIHDRSTTPLRSLSEQQAELSSMATSGLSFLQGGVGLVLRVDFPSLREVLLLERSVILAAELTIVPLKNSYGEFALPEQLILYNADGLNRPLQEGGVALSTFVVDILYQDETTYSFDVTQYLINELDDSYVDPEKGLLIKLLGTEQNSRFTRMIVDAHNKNMKLKIHILSY